MFRKITNKFKLLQKSLMVIGMGLFAISMLSGVQAKSFWENGFVGLYNKAGNGLIAVSVLHMNRVPLCLDMTGWAPANNVRVQLYRCSILNDYNNDHAGYKTSMFAISEFRLEGGDIYASYKIKLNYYPNYCLDYKAAPTQDPANGTQVVIYDCRYATRWVYTNNTYMQGSGISPYFHRHRCIDVPGADFREGIKLQMYSCNNTKAQNFYTFQ